MDNVSHKPTDSQEEGCEGEVVEMNKHVAQVFETPVLMGMILDYGLHDNESEKLDRQNLRNFRLVSHSWKDAVSEHLKEKKEPLFIVTMTAENSLNAEPQVERDGKALDNFVKILATRHPDPNSYAEFLLKMENEVFRRENYDHLVSCLERCGHLLAELELQFPRNGGSLPGVFPNTLNLSALRKLKVWHYLQLENVPKVETFANSSANLIFLLQFLLHQNGDGLKELDLKGFRFPPELPLVKLPSSLVTIRLWCGGFPEVMECLVRNRLPNLENLSIMCKDFHKLESPGKLLFEICRTLCSTLQSLWFIEYTRERPRAPLNLQFPVMEKLEALELRGKTLKLETEIPSISTVFPNLKELRLLEHTQEMLKKWIPGQPAPMVSRVTLNLIDADRRITLPIPVEVMNSVHLTFPNVTSLSLHYSAADFAGLKYVFQEMRQLKRLSLAMEGGDQSGSGSTQHWDAALIGVPLELMAGLAACPRDIWNSIKLEVERAPSIRMLTELTRLELRNSHLISDLTFIQALNGMAKLKDVKLHGRVCVSKQIVDEWKGQSRKIDYIYSD